MDESSIIPAEKVAGAEKKELQGLLKTAVQSVDWTYSVFWQFCPQQRVLVWGNGYYNGAIKTRKTTQPAEVTAEEAALERSQQLRELYETLLAGESTSEARACTALSPEDLTETEWFYLMCVSFSFPPPSGMPGKAYARRKHVWLSGANEVDSKTFSRAILAKTVVCIPMLDGVVELGTTKKNGKEHQQVKTAPSSQWVLKQMIFRVPFLHDNTKDKRLPREDLSHVVAERRRREKLNEKFITLRSMVPFVTKMDKVSILGDTIAYVNHLRKRVHELENTHHEQQHKRTRTCKRKTSEEVEVSIIENDVLLEMRCEYRDGLLLDILQVLHELGIETTAVHTSVNDHDFEAEIRAKVRGKKASIAEVKRAIHQVIIHDTNL
ncbi:putative protein [Arabidopsis thaliana]|nr:hypothetical protein F17A8.170 - Arabidopsis thaliana [Arabidopsis thaliana]CAB39649.1 putative protein [Arabidopsis thaliana]CAB78105.1 putative protein [Arabidopsis thaliana]